MKLLDLIQKSSRKRPTAPQPVGDRPVGPRSSTGWVVDTAKLEEPRPGARLKDYCRSLLGIRPTLDDERDPQLAQARADSQRHGAEIAHRKGVLEKLLERRAQYARAWVRLSLLVIVLAIEFAAAEWLWQELGLDRPWSILLALALVAFTTYLLHAAIQRGVASIWFYIGAAVFIVLTLAVAVVRSGEVEDDADDPVYSNALVFVLVFTVVGPPLIAERLLRAHLEVAPIDRQISEESKQIADLEAQQAAARHYLKMRHREVEKYEEWEELLVYTARAQFPDFFGHDAGAGDPGWEVLDADDEFTKRPGGPGPADARAYPDVDRGRTPGGNEDAAGDDEDQVPIPRLGPDRG